MGSAGTSGTLQAANQQQGDGSEDEEESGLESQGDSEGEEEGIEEEEMPLVSVKRIGGARGQAGSIEKGVASVEGSSSDQDDGDGESGDEEGGDLPGWG